MDLTKIESKYELLDRNRKFAAVFRVASAVDRFEKRLAPFIDPVAAEINWEKFDEELTSGSERVALDWMRGIWTGEFPSGSKALSMLWITDCKLKEAIICALSESVYAIYVLHEGYRTPRLA